MEYAGIHDKIQLVVNSVDPLEMHYCPNVHTISVGGSSIPITASNTLWTPFAAFVAAGAIAVAESSEADAASGLTRY